MKKQNILLVGVILVILTLSIGYAIFRTSIDVVGRSAIVKDLDVEFASIGKITEEGSTNASAVIMSDKKRIKINVPNLSYKGAYALIPVTIKNNGSIPAKLEKIYEYGTNDKDAIKVSYYGIGITDGILEPGDTTTFTIKVSWQGDTNKNYEVIEFLIKFNYVQYRR